MRTALCLVLVVACGKADERKSGLQPDKPPADKPVATDPACAAKAKELEPFLASLLLGAASYEINMGWTPHVIDRAPSPVDQNVDYLVITPKTVAAYDVSEANHVENNIKPGATPKLAAEQLARTFGIKKTRKDEGPDDRIRIDVDAAATWGEVAKLVEAAAQAGYTQAVFAFEATDKLTPPDGLPAKIEDADLVSAARKRIEAMRDICKPWGTAVMRYAYGPPKADNATSVAKEAADAIAACNCAVDPDEVRKVMWQRERWHQAHTRTGVDVKLGTETIIEQPAAMPWSEAHAKLVGATGAIKLVAN